MNIIPAQKEQAAQYKDAPATWTIMVYIVADDTLANFAIESLKQLNRTAGDGVVVAAQLSVEAPGGRKITRYIFREAGFGAITPHSRVLDSAKNVPDEDALADFLSWAYAEPRCQAKNYALILWGHGPELLFQHPSQSPRDGNNDAPNGQTLLYLTPRQLRTALEAGIPSKNGALDPEKKPRLIGLDACSMSMVEVAYEIQHCAEYMVASQEEVPDLSFPYDTLLARFRSTESNFQLCKDSVRDYVLTYQDYICNANTGMKKVTLSALRLGAFGSDHKQGLIPALKSLSDALYAAREEPGLADLLIEARRNSRGFAGGLYVDISGFCDKLRGALGASTQISASASKPLIQACDDVRAAIADPGSNGCILVNQAADPSTCHGVSIYFPFMTDDELEVVKQPMVKGTRDDSTKGFTAVMNRSASNLLLCVRRQLVLDTEEYYADLDFTEATDWYRFIVEVWSPILTARMPEELDLRYSAQQSAMNLLKALNQASRSTAAVPKAQTGQPQALAIGA